MVKRNRLDVDEFFNQVDQTQEVYSLREQVNTLEQKLEVAVDCEQQLISEIEQLRARNLDNGECQQLQSQIDALREHLKQNQGVIQYPVQKIYRNSDQPRQTFKDEVAAMVLSLQEEGQLDPIIIFDDGMLFDGECRWRAAKILGWETIEAVLTARLQDKKTLRRKAYLTSLHRRSLNALDKAETLVAIAGDEIPSLLPQEVPRIVNRVLTRLKRKNQSLGERLHLQARSQQTKYLAKLELDSIEVQVFSLFLGLQEHLVSLNRNIFPALNLTADLKTAVREQGLGCPQALVLNRLTEKELGIPEQQVVKIRAQGVQKVVTENLSTSATQQWVMQQKLNFFNPPSLIRDKQVDRILTTVRAIDISNTTAPPEQLQELQQALETILHQLKQD